VASKNGEALLFEELAANKQDFMDVEDFAEVQKRDWEYQLLGLYTGEHPMQSWRPSLKKKGLYSSMDLGSLASDLPVQVAGLLLYPHRPPTRSGRITVFFSLEDEFGMIDVTMFENVYMTYGSYIFGPQSGPLVVRGRLQRRGEGVSVIAEKIDFCC
jgi:error-prone DNA polymerase